MGNGESKELICTTHGHELRWGNDGGRVGEGYRVEGNKGEKKWDNCNSIINEIYKFFSNIFKKRKDMKQGRQNTAVHYGY